MPLFRKFSVFFVCTGCSSLHGWEEIEDVERLLLGRWGWLLSSVGPTTQPSPLATGEGPPGSPVSTDIFTLGI